MRIGGRILGIAAMVLVLAGCQSEYDPYGRPTDCECPDLRAYVAGLPLIGDSFQNADVTLYYGGMRVDGAQFRPDPDHSELIKVLAEAIPDTTSDMRSLVASPPDWRLFLSPDPDSNLNAMLRFDSIDDVHDLEGKSNPDTGDIEAEAIAHLAELEAALTALADG